MIITAIITAILSYIVIGAVLLLDLTICSRFMGTSEISRENIGIECKEGVSFVVRDPSSLQNAA